MNYGIKNFVPALQQFLHFVLQFRYWDEFSKLHGMYNTVAIGNSFINLSLAAYEVL